MNWPKFIHGLVHAHSQQSVKLLSCMATTCLFPSAGLHILAPRNGIPFLLCKVSGMCPINITPVLTFSEKKKFQKTSVTIDSPIGDDGKNKFWSWLRKSAIRSPNGQWNHIGLRQIQFECTCLLSAPPFIFANSLLRKHYKSLKHHAPIFLLSQKVLIFGEVWCIKQCSTLDQVTLPDKERNMLIVSFIHEKLSLFHSKCYKVQ